MNNISFIVTILLLILLAKEHQLIKTLSIQTKKSIFEKIIIIIFILFLIMLVYFFAEHYLHYLIAILGLIFMIFAWMKQGISDSGILIDARGKQLYGWDQIGKAKISMGKTITIDYFNPSGSKIISHEYKLENYDKILKIFESKKLKFEISNPS